MSDTATPTKTPPTIDLVVQKYLELRDQKASKEAEHKKELETINATLKKAEAHLLARLQEMGVESVRTPFGTAYQSTKTSATVADWNMTLDFIKQGEHWEMLEKRVNKTFVEQYREEHNDLPPGVDWRVERSLNIRRS